MSFIGLCDSGLGGLTILKSLQNQFPYENFLYFADTKSCPFGEKTEQELARIYHNALSIMDGAKSKILACNTLSCFQAKNYPHSTVLSIVDALVSQIEKQSCLSDSIGILATRFTISSKIYPQKIQMLNKNLKIESCSAVQLALAIEQNWDNLDELLYEYLDQFQAIDKLVLACTHYNILYDKIQALYPLWDIIDPYAEIITMVKKQITASNSSTLGNTYYLISEYSDEFQDLSEKIMGQKIFWKQI